MKEASSVLAALVLVLAVPLGAFAAEEPAEELEWDALMPAGFEPEQADLSQFFHRPEDPAAVQQTDAPVVENLAGRRLILEGWLVPLETERHELYHEFLLVPFFGACIHAPPPPTNQTIRLRIDAGVEHYEVFEPQRVTGRLFIDDAVTHLAAASYRMEDASTERANW